MEQENKKKDMAKDGSRDQRGKKPRRRGYFIEPPKQNGETPTPVSAEISPHRKEADPAEKKSGNDRFHHNRRKNNRLKNEQHQKNESQAEGKQNGREAVPIEAKEKDRDKSKHPHNRNKKRHRDRNRPAAQESVTLVDSLSDLNTSFFDSKAEQKKSLVADEDIVPYIPADDDDLTGRHPKQIEDGPTVEVVGIRFKAGGKIYYFDPHGISLTKGTDAIVETARGQEYGHVALGNTQVSESDIVPPLRPVIRGATEADIRHQADNKKKEADALRICNEKIAAHGLDMKLIEAQYTFDNTKLLFYFTSSGRVDFRELVKDLASVFRTRIELRQIGIRDEAKMMGGLGPCGRPLCCTLFLTDFGQVSIKMAKEQNLSLNSSKISGICGRLMCCLRYEYEAYEYEIKRTPPVDSLVSTEDGVGVVTEINPLVGTVKVRLNATPEVMPKVYARDAVTVLQRKQERTDKQEKSDKTEKNDSQKKQ